MGLTLSFDNLKYDFSSLTKRSIKTTKTLVSGYDSNLYRYPIDLGESDRGHYMVIHINEQKKSRYLSSSASELPTVYQNRIEGVNPTLGSALDKDIDAATAAVKRLTTPNAGVANNTTVNKDIPSNQNSSKAGILNNVTTADIGLTDDSFSFSVGFTRTIQRSSETIALYMPDTLNFVYNQSYSDLNIGGGAIAAILTGGASAVDSMGEDANLTKSALKDMAKNLTPFALSMIANSSDIGKAFFAAGAQMVQNPMLELIYTSPAFRTFKFDFVFYPRSEKEAKEVQSILKRLRFHQAPEINLESNGFFLIPPSEFDIKFYYNGEVNPNIPKISTCILESIETDYAPNGFFALEKKDSYTPSMGGTGMPYAIRLSLQFKETEYLTKDHIHVMGY